MTEKVLVAMCLGFLSVACATVVPAPLVAAHVSYTGVEHGPVGQLAPRYLEDARRALDKADGEFTAHGDTDACRDYAYIAENKLELAGSVARTQLMSGGEDQPVTAQAESWTRSSHLTVASAR